MVSSLISQEYSAISATYNGSGAGKQDQSSQIGAQQHELVEQYCEKSVAISTEAVKHESVRKPTVFHAQPGLNSFVKTSAGGNAGVIELPSNKIQIFSQTAPTSSVGQTAAAGVAQPAKRNAGTATQSGASAPQTAAGASSSSAVQPAVSDAVGVTDDDGTRPMAMAPITNDAGISKSSVRPNDSSGGPQPQPAEPATLDWSGGADGGPPLIEGTTSSGAPNGHYTASEPLPVGFVPHLLAGGNSTND